ncbi:hypothetical protein JTE90_025297 [Oedothorax gibbosus]|uniref:DOMON domain-containing protein n=1 Tax=Oedothorax gibbosus TaxID=931172 RepID=A0AAV6V8U4_9ARAC|nr:hypothetical protein JTE90_025297 [Oedothorax gibbosus]
MNYAFRFLIIACIFSMVRSEKWLHCTTLDSAGKYHVCWRLLGEKADTEIEFRVEVETHGYVGFGLSPNGGMAGSDIVTGWVKDGKVYFQDRHGKGNIMPDIDEHQNWDLVSGSENDTHTCLQFRRKLETCDKDDMNIDDSTMRLIYAYSDEDPASEQDLQYHFETRRGAKSALLLQLPSIDRKKVDKSSLKRWDILSPNFELKSSFPTMYWCKIYKAPEVFEKNHIIVAEPLIQQGNEQFVHHILLYECVGGASDEYEPHLEVKGHQCHRPNMPDAMKKCEGVALAWGVGGEDLVLPPNVGLPLNPGPSKYYMMEIHYDNPSRIGGIVDSSGFRLYYTPQVRKYDAGTLMLGSTVSPRMFIPPGVREYTVTGHSNPACLDPDMPQDGINVLGAFLHAHLLGRRLKARHFRNGIELPPLGEDNNYDFNYQEYRYFPKEVKFLPGDQVTMECVYDSSERNVTTVGGESTQEEMCLLFLLYYPRIERFASVSVPTAEVIQNATEKDFAQSYYEFYNDMLTMDWTKLDLKEVQQQLQYGSQDTHCYLGNGEKNSVKETISYPENLHSFKKESACYATGSQKHGNSMTVFVTSLILAALTFCKILNS